MKILPLLALLALFPSAAPAQSSNDAARSDAVVLKIKQLDVLIQVVPLSLTKEQFPPILAALEKVRQQQKEMYAAEAKELAAIDAKLSKMVDDGEDRAIYPPRDAQREIAAAMGKIGARRDELANLWVDRVFATCKTTLNEGQLKVMEKSLKPELLDPSLKVAEMDSDTKVKFFIRKVILDPVAYDVLLKMSLRKEPPAPTTPPANP